MSDTASIILGPDSEVPYSTSDFVLRLRFREFIHPKLVDNDRKSVIINVTVVTFHVKLAAPAL